MKVALKQRTLNHFRNRPGVWIAGGELERLAMSIGFTGSTLSRRVRELCAEGKLERQEVNGHAWYRWRGEKETRTYLPVEPKQGVIV